MAIFTIGYEGLDIESFRDILIEHDVETVVDVRELPLSRKPGFSKTKLSASLISAGIEYEHFPTLGCPKAIRHQFKEDGDWQQYKSAFLKHLAKQTKSLEGLAELADLSNCALMCFEADASGCHRSLVATKVSKLNGGHVVHIESGLMETINAAAR